MATHSKFSASSSARWLKCPASIKASEGIPPLPSTAYAEEGTLAHSALEETLRILLKKKSPDDALSKYPGEIQKHAREASEFILSKLTPPGADFFIEHRASLSFIKPGVFGTADVVIADHFNTLKVVDFKYGAGYAVDVREPDGTLNSQLAFYALGVAHHFHYNFETVSLGVYQPRAFHPEAPYREASVPMAELKEWTPIFKDGIKKALGPKPPFEPGSHCKWCPAKLTCPELSTKPFGVTRLEFDSLTPEVTSKNAARLLPIPRTPEEFGQVLSAIDALRVWMKAVEEGAYHLALGGTKIPGHKLVAKKAIRKWVDLARTSAEAEAVLGIHAYDKKLKGVTDLDQLMGKEWVNARTAKVSSGVDLVHESDRRPEAQGPSNAIDFPKSFDDSEFT